VSFSPNLSTFISGAFLIIQGSLWLCTSYRLLTTFAHQTCGRRAPSDRTPTECKCTFPCCHQHGTRARVQCTYVCPSLSCHFFVSRLPGCRKWYSTLIPHVLYMNEVRSVSSHAVRRLRAWGMFMLYMTSQVHHACCILRSGRGRSKCRFERLRQVEVKKYD